MSKLNEVLNTLVFHHIEKVILGVGVSLLVTFIWLGYSTPVFNKTTPVDLANGAKQAGRYIQDQENWNRIAEFRRGDSTAPERILKAENSLSDLRNRNYIYDHLMGTRVKTRGLRRDPKLISPGELVAMPFQSVFLINKSENARDRVFAITKLPKADGGETQTGRSQKKGEYDIGHVMPETQKKFMLGVRPHLVPVNKRPHRARVFDAVAIFGVVEFKKQWSEYDNVFKEATSYYPERDRPKYSYVEVQRREKNNGVWSKWVDVTRANRHFERTRFPVSMPNGAPEVIAAECFDQVLTAKIPLISLQDYRKFANHPNGKIKPRDFGPLEVNPVSTTADDAKAPFEGEDYSIVDPETQQDTTVQENDPSAESQDHQLNNSPENRANKNGRRGSDFTEYVKIMNAKEPMHDYKLLRFYDTRVKQGVDYQYRVRIWVADPNHESKDGDGIAGSNTDTRREKLGSTVPGMGDEGRDDRAQSSSDELNYEYVELSPWVLDIAVRRRLNQPMDDYPMPWLKHSRATEWAYVTVEPNFQSDAGDHESEPGTVKLGEDTSEITMGAVHAGIRYKSPIGNHSVHFGDSTVEMVVAGWAHTYGTKMAGHKTARRGDTLNFRPDHSVHLLHPIDWSVRKIEGPDIPILNSDVVVVDIMGGEKIAIKNAIDDYHLPGEVLILDGQGNFRVHNDLDDHKQLRHSLFLKDCSSTEGDSEQSHQEDERGGLPDR